MILFKETRKVFLCQYLKPKQTTNLSHSNGLLNERPLQFKSSILLEGKRLSLKTSKKIYLRFHLKSSSPQNLLIDQLKKSSLLRTWKPRTLNSLTQLLISTSSNINQASYETDQKNLKVHLQTIPKRTNMNCKQNENSSVPYELSKTSRTLEETY
mgnify:FL=1